MGRGDDGGLAVASKVPTVRRTHTGSFRAGLPTIDSVGLVASGIDAGRSRSCFRRVVVSPRISLKNHGGKSRSSLPFVAFNVASRLRSARASFFVDFIECVTAAHDTLSPRSSYFFASCTRRRSSQSEKSDITNRRELLWCCIECFSNELAVGIQML